MMVKKTIWRIYSASDNNVDEEEIEEVVSRVNLAEFIQYMMKKENKFKFKFN